MFARLFYPTQADVKIKLTIETFLGDNDGRLIKTFTDGFSAQCLEYLFDLREGIEAKLKEISGGLPGIKKQIVALGFNNKDNVLDDPEKVNEFSEYGEWKLEGYVADVKDKKVVEPLKAKMKECRQAYLNQIKLQGIEGLLELTIAAKPVADKQELEKLKSKTATDVRGDNLFVKTIFGK
jgi:hypothetical protein